LEEIGKETLKGDHAGQMARGEDEGSWRAMSRRVGRRIRPELSNGRRGGQIAFDDEERGGSRRAR
jgi:hypothetical protein